jgi:hypothetical protein
MTDTTDFTAHIVDADHMPRLADLNDDTSPYPAQIGIFCDDCHTEHLADYLVAADSTREQRFEVAREHLRGQGWSCTEAGDLCPNCQQTILIPGRCNHGPGRQCVACVPEDGFAFQPLGGDGS